MQEGYTDSIGKEEKDLREALESRELQEETIWKTESRNICLKEGEINSYFLFRGTTQHFQFNRIICLKADNGIVVETHGDIEHTLTNHLRQLMEELDLGRIAEMKEILENIPSLVTQEKKNSYFNP